MGERHLMHNKLLLGFVLFSLTSVGLISVNAEPFEVEVPFDYNKSGCTLTANQTDYKFYDCYASFQAFNATEFLPNLVWDEVDKEYKTPEQLEEEAKAIYLEELINNNIVEFEGRVFETNPETRTDKLMIKQINEMLDSNARCFQGADGTNTAGIQNERNFPIPTIDIQKFDDDGDSYTITVLDTRAIITNEDLKGYLGVIEKYKRECQAQMILDDSQGGILSSFDKQFAYCDDVPNTTAEFDPQCGKVYRDHSVIASNIPIWSQERVNQEANFVVEQNSFSIEEDICNGYYSDIYKQTFKECQIEYESGNGVIPNGEIFNKAEEKMKQYKSDGGAQMAKELSEKVIAEKISRLLEQIRLLESQK